MPCINRIHNNDLGKFFCVKYVMTCDPIVCGEMDESEAVTRADVLVSGMCLASEGCSAWEYRYPNDPSGCYCPDAFCPVINPDTKLDVDEPAIPDFNDIPF